MTIAAAILVGGRALRFGGLAKPLLVVDGRTILARQLDALATIADEILLVGQDLRVEEAAAGWTNVRCVVDNRPGLGPLAGLDAALGATGADAVILVAGDMPSLVPAALALLRDAPAGDAAAFSVDGRLAPLPARFARSLAPSVRARLDGDDRSLRGLLAAANVAIVAEAALRAVDPGLASLVSIDTPEALARFACEPSRG